MPIDENTKRVTKSLRHYSGFVFRWQPYKELSPRWNQDHCQGCWARFAERPDKWRDNVRTEGWVTLWPVSGTAEQEEKLVANWRAAGQVLVPSPKVGGFRLDWLCPKCFETCQQDLGFVIDSEHPQWQKAGL